MKQTSNGYPTILREWRLKSENQYGGCQPEYTFRKFVVPGAQRVWLFTRVSLQPLTASAIRPSDVSPYCRWLFICDFHESWYSTVGIIWQPASELLRAVLKLFVFRLGWKLTQLFIVTCEERLSCITKIYQLGYLAIFAARRSDSF